MLPAWALWLAFGFMTIGLAGAVLPGIPGVGLIWLTVLVYALAEAGAAEPNRAGALFDARERLGKYAQGYLALALGVIGTIDNPARRGVVTELVEPALIPNAMALNTATMTGSRAIGPALAAVLTGPAPGARRREAALALVRFQATGAVEALDPLAARILDEREDPALRVAILEALQALDPPLAPATLRPLLKRLATSPDPDGQNANAGYQKLAIHLPNVTSRRVAVWFVPLPAGREPPGASTPRTTRTPRERRRATAPARARSVKCSWFTCRSGRSGRAGWRGLLDRSGSDPTTISATNRARCALCRIWRGTARPAMWASLAWSRSRRWTPR